jgi:IS5 family transposase
MLRLSNDQRSLWESVLPEEVLQLSEELTRIDELLEDERFFKPFRDKFHTRRGRPTVPVATYLRMMYLKRRYGLGYESLVKEVKDSFSWRHFCHLSFNDPVPDASTLIKLTHKYGEDTVKALNDALVVKLKESKVVRGQKLRLDTTVVEANIHYPTDASLLADGIKLITRSAGRISKAGVGGKARVVNRMRKVKKIMSGISRVVRERISISGPNALQGMKELMDVARGVVVQGRDVLREAEGKIGEIGIKVRREIFLLKRWLDLSEKIMGQTEAVLKGERHIPDRIVSLFDTSARPIVRGKARNPVEFGRKVLLGETDKGIITTYQVVEGNPADSNLLRPGVKGHRLLFRRRLKAVTADRGFQSLENERWLEEQKVKRIALPFRGKKDKERREYEKQPWFCRLTRFRAGCEGRISHLKRVFGLDRSLMGGADGTEIWVGQGIFAYNLWQATRIM